MTSKITYVKDANGEVLIRKRKRRRKHLPQLTSKKQKIVISIAVAILLLIFAIIICYFVGMFNMKTHYDEGKIIHYNGHTYMYNENLISMSFIGYDKNETDDNEGREGQADFLVIMALDTENSTMKGLSIPRDTIVEPNDYSGASYFGNAEKEQIAVTFSYGHEIHESCEKTTEAMSRLIYNVPIKYYFGLNLEGIAHINDSVGGVSLKALETIPNSNIEKDKTLTLHGDNAQKYVRWRNKSILESSQMRRARDDQYMKCFYEQSMSKVRDVFVAADLYNAGLEYASTNLGVPEFVYLLQTAMTQNINSFDIKTIKGEMKQGSTYAEFWPNETDIYEKMLDIFYIMID